MAFFVLKPHAESRGHAAKTRVAGVLTPLFQRFSVNSNLLVYQFCTPCGASRNVQRRAGNGTVHRGEAAGCDDALDRNVSSDKSWLKMAYSRRWGLPSGRGRGLQFELKFCSSGDLEHGGLEHRGVGGRHDVALLGGGEHGDRLCRVGHQLPAVCRRLWCG